MNAMSHRSQLLGLVGLIACAALLWGLVAPGHAQENETATESEAGEGIFGESPAKPPKPQPAPPELVKAVAQAIKNSQTHALWRGVRASVVQEDLPEWEIQSKSFLDTLVNDIRDPRVALRGGRAARLLGWGDEDPSLLVVEIESGGETTRYAVPRAGLQALDFEIASSMEWTDPANRPLERFSVGIGQEGDEKDGIFHEARSTTIFDVAPKLCELGELDLAMPAGAADGVVGIVLSLRNKSAAECLRYMANALDYKITFSYTFDYGRRREGPSVPNVVIGEPEVECVLRTLPAGKQSADGARAALKQHAERRVAWRAEHRPAAIITGRVQKR